MPTEPASHRERIAIGSDGWKDPDVLVDVERYRFACQFVGAKRVLDIACGLGYGAHLLLREGHAAAVIAVDSSPETIGTARSEYSSDRLKFEVGTAESIPLPDCSVDVAVSIETFEHLPEPRLLLTELRRVLAPGGKAIISTPRNESAERVRPSNPFHLREYSWDEFGQIVQTVFPKFERWSQVTEYGDPLIPHNFGNATNPVRALLRRIVPGEIRLSLRRALGLRGLRPVRSRIIPGMDPSSTVQLVIGFKV